MNDGTTSNDDRLGAIGDTGFVLDQTGLDDDLVVVAGDNLFGEDVSGFAAYGQEVDAPVLAVHDVGDLALMSEYNQIEIDDEGRITFFEEKPENARSTLAGVALYFYPRHTLPLIRQYLEAGNNPDQPGRLIEWLYPRTSVYTWRLPGRWYDIGSAETLQEADRIFSQSRRRVAADNDGVLELLFPERCAVCRRPGSALCEHCRDSFVRLSPPICERCGSPGAWPVRRCAECSGRRLAFARARAAIVYDGGAKSFVRSWKEHGQRRLAAVAAEIVAEAISVPDVDVLAHVPGDPERAWERGMVAPKGLALALGESAGGFRPATSCDGCTRFHASAVSHSRIGGETSAAASLLTETSRARCASSTTSTPRVRPPTRARRHSAARARPGSRWLPSRERFVRLRPSSSVRRKGRPCGSRSRLCTTPSTIR